MRKNKLGNILFWLFIVFACLYFFCHPNTLRNLGIIGRETENIMTQY